MPDEAQRERLFEQCVDAHAESLYRVAYRLTGNHDLANELTQESYLQAWAHIGTLKEITKLRSWMFAILRNQYSKLIRKIARTRQLDDSTANSIAAPQSEYSGEEPDSVRSVRNAIEQLEENQKLPLLLVAMEGLSVEEAADALDIPKGTVLSRMHRGRKKLKSILKSELEIEELQSPPN